MAASIARRMSSSSDQSLHQQKAPRTSDDCIEIVITPASPELPEFRPHNSPGYASAPQRSLLNLNSTRGGGPKVDWSLIVLLGVLLIGIIIVIILINYVMHMRSVGYCRGKPRPLEPLPANFFNNTQANNASNDNTSNGNSLTTAAIRRPTSPFVLLDSSKYAKIMKQSSNVTVNVDIEAPCEVIVEESEQTGATSSSRQTPLESISVKKSTSSAILSSQISVESSTKDCCLMEVATASMDGAGVVRPISSKLADVVVVASNLQQKAFIQKRQQEQQQPWSRHTMPINHRYRQRHQRGSPQGNHDDLEHNGDGEGNKNKRPACHHSTRRDPKRLWQLVAKSMETLLLHNDDSEDDDDGHNSWTAAPLTLPGLAMIALIGLALAASYIHFMRRRGYCKCFNSSKNVKDQVMPKRSKRRRCHRSTSIKSASCFNRPRYHRRHAPLAIMTENDEDIFIENNFFATREASALPSTAVALKNVQRESALQFLGKESQMLIDLTTNLIKLPEGGKMTTLQQPQRRMQSDRRQSIIQPNNRIRLQRNSTINGRRSIPGVKNFTEAGNATPKMRWRLLAFHFDKPINRTSEL